MATVLSLKVSNLRSSPYYVVWIDDGIQIRVYYQDPELYLRAYCQDWARGAVAWTRTLGLSKHGTHPQGTPIAAEVLQERQGVVRISLSWKASLSISLGNFLRDLRLQTILSPRTPSVQ